MKSAAYFLVFLLVGAFAAPQQETPVSIEDLENGYFFSNNRIVGGEIPPEGYAPWMAALSSGSLIRSFICGGSVITTRLVLTAAHCIGAMVSCGIVSGCTPVSSAAVNVGSHRWNSGGARYSISENRTHHHYVATTIKNDIGFFIINGHITLNPLVQPVRLNFEHIPGGVGTTTCGLGRIGAGQPLASEMMCLSKRTLDGEQCQRDVLAHALANNVRNAPPVEPHIEICTFHSVGRGTCNGDSGSALVTTDRKEQVGVVSWGFACALGAPDMFARVSGFHDWIQNVISSTADLPL